jgi:hypothetical protein
MNHFLYTILIFIVLFLVGTLVWARPVTYFSVNAGSTAITTGAWLQVSAATTSSCSRLRVVNATNQLVYLGVGGAGAESEIKYLISQGAMVHDIDQPLSKGVRLAARALGANATSGYLVINCIQ